ncbi:MAG: pirin family protein [Pseudomonadota bacterium]
MTAHPCPPPHDAATPRSDALSRFIRPKAKDIGEFEVRRVLPAGRCRSVGPFIFFDHMGPAAFAPGKGINVRPHPHVCLSTMTYLFEGEIMHRDSLGYAQLIRPGAINLMRAGRGIVHSERAGPDLQAPSRLDGIQTWMALPAEHEEAEPAFDHYPAETIPAVEVDGVSIRVVMGEALGARSPVRTLSPTVYLDVVLGAGQAVHIPRESQELAAYVAHGSITVDGQDDVAGGVMAVVADGADFAARGGAQGARLILVGGSPLGPRHLWWNFVASDPARIEQAKRDWRDGRFEKVPGDDEEFIPLPT